MEHLENMDTTLGQAQNTAEKSGIIQKVLSWLGDSKTAKNKQLETLACFTMLQAAQSELNTVRSNLNCSFDTDDTEINIYRLKAAELNFNRHIKLAKAASLSVSPFREESL